MSISSKFLDLITFTLTLISYFYSNPSWRLNLIIGLIEKEETCNSSNSLLAIDASLIVLKQLVSTEMYHKDNCLSIISPTPETYHIGISLPLSLR